MTLLKRILTASLLALMLFSLACSKNRNLYRKAAREYRHGELEASLNSSVELLRQKPDYYKAQKLIKKTYPRLVEEVEQRLLELGEAPPEVKWDSNVEEYTRLAEYENMVNSLNPLVNPKTGEKYNFENRGYQEKLDQCKFTAAEFHYQKALDFLEQGDNPDIHRNAVKELQATLNYVPDYRDALQLYTHSRQFSTKRVAISPFEDKSGTRDKYGGLIDLLTDTLISKLVQDKTVSEYWDIVSRDQINIVLTEQQYGNSQIPNSGNDFSRLQGAHEIMIGKIIQVNYVPERTSELELRETKNIVTGKETYITDKGKKRQRKVKEDVTCVYRRYTKTASVRITASFTLVDVKTGVAKTGDTVTAEYPWTDVWGRVVNGGDERVLSAEALALIRREEPFPPAEMDMVNVALNKLSDEIVARVRTYVGR